MEHMASWPRCQEDAGLRYPVPLIKAPQHPQGLSPARPGLFIHHWEPSPLAQPRAALLPTLPSGLHAAPLPGRNPGLTTYFTRTSLHTLSHPHLTSSPHPFALLGTSGTTEQVLNTC